MDTTQVTPAPLRQLLDGFRGTKILAVAVQLKLFDLLAAKDELNVEEIARALDLAERPTRMLLTACTALGLLEHDGQCYDNTPVSRQFLVSSEPNYFGGFIEMVEHQQYPGWEHLLVAIRENRPTVWDSRSRDAKFVPDDPEQTWLFWNAMASVSGFAAKAVADAFDFSPFRSVLDVGGGPGSYSIELCARFPELRATVYDLPFMCRLTAEKLDEISLSDRIDTCGGDFLTGELPAGHDLALLGNVLHMWDESTNRQILLKCHAALRDGGTVVISEEFVDDDGTGPVEASLMSVNMLVDTVGGQNYTRREYEALLAEVGFTAIQRIPMRTPAPGVNGLIAGRKPVRG